MTVQPFLLSSFRFFSRDMVSSVETVLDDVKAEWLANSPVWTVVDNRPGTDSILGTSPVDSDGRFFDVLLTNVAGSSNLKLEMRVRDQNAITLCTRRINATSSSTWMVRIYTGQYHTVIDFDYHSVAAEAMWAGILDLSPESQVAHSHYVYGNAPRTNADSVQNNAWDNAFMVDNVTAAVALRVATYYDSTSITRGSLYTSKGFIIFRPIPVWAVPTGGGTAKYAGRFYQMLQGTAGSFGEGAQVTIPIDVNTTGVFRLVGGMGTSASGNAVVFCRVS